MLSSIKHPRLSSAAIARAIQAIIDQLTETITERLFLRHDSPKRLFSWQIKQPIAVRQ
jgi:hypothetical protein